MHPEELFGDQAMDDSYYRHVRRDIEPLLPATARHILDVGAGVGATSAWLRSRYPDSYIVGLEGNSSVRTKLAQNVDKAVIVDLNGRIPCVGSPDLVLCLDVLEHLIQPLDVLVRLTTAVAEGGTVIVSLPNVAHASVSLPLLLKGRFEYREAGILDRTHLRFFDRLSAIQLMNKAGFIVRKGVRGGLRGPRSRLLDTVTCGRVRDLLTKQYVLAGQREVGAQQETVAWSIA
jgi:SAM-dependent methyltransferase